MRFTIGGITAEQYILAYRSKDSFPLAALLAEERQWDFRSIDLHHFQTQEDQREKDFKKLKKT